MYRNGEGTPQNYLRSSSGSFAKFTAMRRANHAFRQKAALEKASHNH